MAKLHIVDIDRENRHGLIVTFSDGTFAEYATPELLELRPKRQTIENASDTFPVSNEQF